MWTIRAQSIRLPKQVDSADNALLACRMGLLHLGLISFSNKRLDS
jgi:hypothetical protein